MGSGPDRPPQRYQVRALALQVVMQTLEENQYCDKVLHQILAEHTDLPKQDRAFITRLSEGTVERCIELDYIIAQYSKVPVPKMKPVIRCIMRMAVYQFRYMDQVPNRAACDEAVRLAARWHLQGLRGFVNGVLRNIERHLDEIPYPDPEDFVQYASVRYSMPVWIIQYYLQAYPQETVEAVLQSYLERNHATAVRCNSFLGNAETKTDRIQEVRNSLQKQGVQAAEGNLLPEALRLRGYDRLEELEVFRRGMIQVQAESSMLVGRVSGILPGNAVMDVCAAPGGKTIHAADLLQGKGSVTACDITKAKVELIRQNTERTGARTVQLYQQDARVLQEQWIETADVLIADLPCSGLGVLGTKCDIKYHVKPADIQTLAALQREILQVASRYVKPGGTLLFSTCTVGFEENQHNVQWIKDNLPFDPEPMEDSLPEPLQGRTGREGYLQILPTDGTDGFFIAKFTKR